jgi:SAM-dependent MidA family methyltransferase
LEIRFTKPLSMSTSSNALRDFLAAQFAAAEGRMPFERFMELALYDPDFGYYTRHIASVGGRRADFATSATISPILGQAIAGWLQDERNSHGWAKQPWHVIEVGGGDGSLAQAVLEALTWGERRKLSYYLVEISPVLEAVQREALGRRTRGVTWHRDITTPLDAAGGRALIFSNELVDAFPARLMRWNAQRAAADEVWVEYNPERGLRECFLAADERGGEGAAFADGQRFERHDSYRRWLRSWATKWKAGTLLTIDYGGRDAAAIYAKRPLGTLRGFHRHQRCEGASIYRHFGKQDLTCDVNFADLEEWGSELGWETVIVESQADFFRRQLVEEDFVKDRATAFLLDAEGAGGVFQVLTQRVTTDS